MQLFLRPIGNVRDCLNALQRYNTDQLYQFYRDRVELKSNLDDHDDKAIDRM